MDNNKLSLEQQEKLKKLEILFPHLSTLLNTKVATLPTLASLSAMILIVATFNERLISITEGFKWAITILIIMIPMSLLVFYLEIETAAKKTKEEIEKMIGTKINSQKKKVSAKIRDFIFGYSSIVFLLIFTVIIIYFIKLIWN